MNIMGFNYVVTFHSILALLRVEPKLGFVFSEQESFMRTQSSVPFPI